MLDYPRRSKQWKILPACSCPLACSCASIFRRAAAVKPGLEGNMLGKYLLIRPVVLPRFIYYVDHRFRNTRGKWYL